ncbi:EAL domain-containing protein [Jiella endophytica]|uniref:EAL domain-containing protein n=1 Tax=Jiella endophytica TaxID=2558362 RepID=A0A4Y8RNE8_9HYPH|nr:EAL domain-containing protein [Jiella endophytica]TFF25128.1 EAL domain-containing protein [Jiella endophytica]
MRHIEPSRVLFLALGFAVSGITPAFATATETPIAAPSDDVYVWVLISAGLVLLMQIGFLLLEAGMVRSKNSINVAQKNLLDLLLSIVGFAAVGFMFAFGGDSGFGFGHESRFAFLNSLTPGEHAFFAFQVMFCGTAATIVSGAAAERLRLAVYGMVSILIAAFIYPIFTHWAWGNALQHSDSAFLANLGFIDFAGSTVVHSTGAWISLAACIVLGPRIGRFAPDGTPQRIQGHSAVLATAGAMIIFVGWIGFNGGSTIEASPAIAGIISNTVLAAGCGGTIGYLYGLWKDDGLTRPEMPICGLIGGLVAVTAGCHVLDGLGAMTIGLVGGLIAIVGNDLVTRCGIDDAVGAIGCHGFSGIAGTLGLALLAPSEAFASGDRLTQLGIQAAGAGVNFLWTFPIAFLFFKLADLIEPIRVSPADEERGLNQAEHGAVLGTGSLETALTAYISGRIDLSHRLPVETGDETERVTRLFNAFLDEIENSEMARRDSEALRRTTEEAERLAAIGDASFEGLAVIVDGRVFDMNAAFARLIGLSAEALAGAPIVDLVDRDSECVLAALMDSEITQAFELSLKRSDGALIPVEARSRAIVLRGVSARVMAFADVSERRAAEEKLRFTAHHDALTQLPNRALFASRLDAVIARACETRRSAALISVDLDHFKDINDLYGHPAGDAVLRKTAERLRQAVGPQGIVARLGGDEFAIILADLAFRNQVADLAFRIVRTICEPVDIGNGIRIRPGASVGFALAPDDAVEQEALISRADVALYHAKRNGRNTFAGFEAGMDTDLKTRRELDADLARAVERNELSLAFQPRVGMRSGGIVSYEALVRWNHPERGMIRPGLFIPIAEQSGKIDEIGNWVIREACRQSLSKLGGAAISVNVSGHQLRSRNFVENVLAMLEEAEFPPERFEIELTESILVEDRDRALAILKALKRRGIRLALDDFGTGYSSLSYLRAFPFDTIKIDRSFIMNLANDNSSLAIADAVMNLGRALKLTIVAEGVETIEQLTILSSRNCDEVQGFLFSQPLPAGDVPQAIDGQLSEILRDFGGNSRSARSA